jgi:hypothetical protein
LGWRLAWVGTAGSELYDGSLTPDGTLWASHGRRYDGLAPAARRWTITSIPENVPGPCGGPTGEADTAARKPRAAAFVI